MVHVTAQHMLLLLSPGRKRPCPRRVWIFPCQAPLGIAALPYMGVSPGKALGTCIKLHISSLESILNLDLLCFSFKISTCMHACMYVYMFQNLLFENKNDQSYHVSHKYMGLWSIS